MVEFARIVLDEPCPCCGRFRSSGWYADVPAEFVEA